MTQFAIRTVILCIAVGATWIGASAITDALVARCTWPGIPAAFCATGEPPVDHRTADDEAL